MDRFVNEKDFELLARDRYTFAVLDRILRGECDLVRADHKGLILCHSAAPYPVWIWTPDGIAGAAKEQAWRLAAECRPPAGGYRFNMKHELAAYFLERGREEGTDLRISMELFAYDCPDPAAPDVPADGEMRRCGPEDAEEAAALMPLFYTEIGEQPPDREHCLAKARAYIGEGAFFFWKNGAGKTAACCSFKSNQGLASLGSVYTLPEYRRRHYAQHLVYQVTKRVQALGLTPMLYTNAGYPASNACYQKIGYTLRGRLCTVAAQSEGTR